MSFLTSAFCVEVGYTKHYFLGKHLEVHFERIVALCLRKQANQILINFMYLLPNTRYMYTMNNELIQQLCFGLTLTSKCLSIMWLEPSHMLEASNVSSKIGAVILMKWHALSTGLHYTFRFSDSCSAQNSTTWRKCIIFI